MKVSMTHPAFTLIVLPRRVVAAPAAPADDHTTQLLKIRCQSGCCTVN